MIGCIPEPVLNIFFLKLDDLSDSVQFLKDTGYSHFCTKRSAGSSAPEPAGRRGGGGRPRRLRILPYRLRADARDPQRRSDADVG